MAKALIQTTLAGMDAKAQETRSRKQVTTVAILLSCMMLVLLARIFLLQSGWAKYASGSRLFMCISNAQKENATPSYLDYVQANTSAQIADMAEDQTVKRQLVAFRGAITDRHGRVMAASQLRYRLFMDPKMVLDHAESTVEKQWPTAEDLAKKGEAAIPPDALPGDAQALRDIMHSGLSGKERVLALHEALAKITAGQSHSLFEAAWRALPERLARELLYSPAEIARIQSAMQGREKKSYVVLDDLLTPERLEAFRKLTQSAGKEDRLPGLGLEPRSLRCYPLGQTAGQLIGFTGKEEVLADGRRTEKGLEGLERLWNKRLQATNGIAEAVVDRHRKPIWISSDGYKLPQDGENVQLSIDAHIQEVAEKQLAITCTKYHVQSGVMIVMQPNTGEILAMANWPPFDPSKSGKYGDDERQKLVRNRAVADIFEPGSIFKPLVWGSLVDQGLVRPEDKFNCTTDGELRVPGRMLHDAHKGHGHGTITWNQVLAYSSNIGMALGAMKSNPAKLHGMIAGWGIGASTHSGLSGEENGILHPARKWTSLSMSSLPMGQEVSVTTLQIMRAYCAIANGGLLLKPTVEVVDGRKITKMETTRAISEKGAALTRHAMRMCVIGVDDTDTHATGRLAKSKYYDIFGKTGTAQLPKETGGGYYQDRYISSFIGGAPLDHPRLVVGCFLRDPSKKFGHYGGTVAGPYVANTLEASLVYLGVPTNPGTDPSKMYGEWDARCNKMADEIGVEWP